MVARINSFICPSFPAKREGLTNGAPRFLSIPFCGPIMDQAHRAIATISEVIPANHRRSDNGGVLLCCVLHSSHMFVTS